MCKFFGLIKHAALLILSSYTTVSNTHPLVNFIVCLFCMATDGPMIGENRQLVTNEVVEFEE
jgi:hypothetical protein